LKIVCHDVVGLVRCAWDHSFARVESTQKTIPERGWNPLTYNLLDDPDLERKKITGQSIRVTS
jgi:hypothetical protein